MNSGTLISIGNGKELMLRRENTGGVWGQGLLFRPRVSKDTVIRTHTCLSQQIFMKFGSVMDLLCVQ